MKPVVNLIRIGPDLMKPSNAVMFHLISFNETVHTYFCLWNVIHSFFIINLKSCICWGIPGIEVRVT